MKLRQQTVQNQRGVSALILIFMLLGLLIPIAASFSVLHLMRVSNMSKDYTRLVARETAKSSFLVMEAALQRRLWEMPPTNQCLKNTNFYMKGETPEGATYRVDVAYDVTTKILVMVSKATFRGMKFSFEKKAKILDASEFLVYSKSLSTTTLSRDYDSKTPVGFFGMGRKVYFEGPVEFGAILARPSNPTNWSSPTPMELPAELGTIVQGDRLYFLKGLKTADGPMPMPNPEFVNELAMLGPYANKYLGQYGAGSTVITNDYPLALQLQSSVISGLLSDMPSMSLLQKYIYPTAFFCGKPPMISTSTTPDSGCYTNDPNQKFVISYGWGGISGWGCRSDYTCLTEIGVAKPKFCTSSNDYPAGFRNWRRDAGLEGYLYGQDGPTMSFDSITWDNMESLKEDATACGWVVSSVPTYEDCDLSNQRVLTDYISGLNSCEQIAQVDMESLPTRLANFAPADYLDSSKKDLFLRRVIYSDRPTELSQSQSTGLISTMSSPSQRDNLSLWFVNEDRFVLKTFQADLTSPLDINPGKRRILFFNNDSAGILNSINLLLLTPEAVQIVSPQHVPITHAEMQLALPVVGGNIKPKNHAFTDAYHQEEDGFKYGMRDIVIGNLTLVTNNVSPGGNSNSGFSLRGIWGVANGSAERIIQSACMFSDPVSHTPIEPFVSAGPNSNFPWVGTGPAAPDSVVPPKGSRFYAPGAQTPPIFEPYIFNVQSATGIQSSRILHTGSRILMNFDASTPGGRKNLSNHRLEFQPYGFPADLSDRRYAWAEPYWYVKTAGAPCDGSIFNLSGQQDPGANYVFFNTDNALYSQRPLPSDRTNLGAVFGQSLPFVELSQ